MQSYLNQQSTWAPHVIKSDTELDDINENVFYLTDSGMDSLRGKE